VLDMIDFDVILLMDWLSLYYAVLDCISNTIILSMHDIPPIMWTGVDSQMSRGVILLFIVRGLVGRVVLLILLMFGKPLAKFLLTRQFLFLESSLMCFFPFDLVFLLIATLTSTLMLN